MNKFDPTSHNITDEKKAELKSLFPEAFTEQGIDFDRLKSLLGEVVESGSERYSFTWPGKSEAIRASQLSSMGTLSPDKGSSVDWDTTKNLYLEGDNLEVLKLLQKSYTGKIKIIYIDPPYNTGNDFVYPDNYGEGLKTYLEYTGQVDGQGKKLSTNTETDGRYHSKWLNMMYPRLMLARNLLKNNGVIFISIDDHEVTNLKKICDEIFGGDNFIAKLVWKKKYTGGKHTKGYVDLHEYILVYSKNINVMSDVEITRPDEEKDKFTEEDEFLVERGRFYVRPLKSNLELRPTLIYPIIAPDGTIMETQWMIARDTFDKFLSEKRVEFRKKRDGAYQIYRKYYEHDGGGMIKPPSLIEKYPNNDAKIELKELFEISEGRDNVFYTVKPTGLINHLLTPFCFQDDIVLDFFSGSGTTAHSVMQLNVEDGGNRKFIMVQLPEEIEKESEVYKMGYKNITEIGKERIRRAGVKICEENADKIKTREMPLDTGFKTYRLTSSTFNVWDVKNKDDIQQKLIGATSLIKDNAKEEDILSELILKSGYGLTEKVETFTILGKNFYSIANGSLIISLETGLTLDIVRQLAEKKPSQFVAREHGFGSDDVLTNIAQIMKDKGIDFRVL